MTGRRHPSTARGTVRSVHPQGAYDAKRSAALSGVPLSTVHYWARNEILMPTVTPVRTKLWSYADLMGLRTIYWLRQTKRAGNNGFDVPRTSMPAIKRALKALAELDLDLWTESGGPAIAVDRSGKLYLRARETVETTSRQSPLDPDLLDLVSPFPTIEGTKGPDLQAPRPRLRIVPGKLAGAPHVEHTRIETQALAALARRGMPTTKLRALYPLADDAALDQALDLEHQLATNLSAAA